MKVVWDEPKRLATIAERGLDFAMVTPEFFRSATIQPAREARFRALGRIGSEVFVVVFRPLGTEAVSIISLRRASRRERRSL